MKVSKGYIISGTLIGLLLSLVVFGLGYFYFILNSIEYDPSNGTIPIETGLENLDAPEGMKEGMAIPVLKDKRIWNVLLIGSDARSSKERGRSDAMILVTVNEKTGKIHLTSLMRAIYVSIPNEPDPEYSSYYSPNYMLNAAHTWGGPNLLLKTVQRNFRVHVPYYIKVDFNNFVNSIDAIGGVKIELSAAEAEHLNYKYGYSLKAGVQRLNGKQALNYSRIRKIDSDFYRMERQRKVIKALIEEMRGSDVVSLSKTAEEIAPSLTTNYTKGQMFDLIRRAPIYQKYEVDELMLPVETYDAMTYINGMEMYVIDWPRNINTLHEFMKK